MSDVKYSGKAGCEMEATASAGGACKIGGPVMENHWVIEAHDKFGNLKWRDEFDNLVTNAGLNDLLDKYLKGSAYTAAFYVGLTDGTPSFAAADTMASHGGWTEVVAYDEAVRQTLTLGTVSSQSVDNSASKAVFTISTNGTDIGGAFICTDDTKGATDGVLYGGGALSAGDKGLDDGDTLSVTVTCTAAAA